MELIKKFPEFPVMSLHVNVMNVIFMCSNSRQVCIAFYDYEQQEVLPGTERGTDREIMGAKIWISLFFCDKLVNIATNNLS